MFINNDTIFSDAGKFLKHNTISGFFFKKNPEELKEIDFLPKIEFKNGYLYYGHEFHTSYKDKPTMASWIKYFVKLHYSLDSQMAIMLNKDNDEAHMKTFEQMQEWRKWSKEMAKKCYEFVKNNS